METLGNIASILGGNTKAEATTFILDCVLTLTVIRLADRAGMVVSTKAGRSPKRSGGVQVLEG